VCLVSQIAVTEEERRLSESRLFEQRISECYRRLCHTNAAAIPFVVVDTSAQDEQATALLVIDKFHALCGGSRQG
jgi:hypothetical protein